MLKGKIYPNKYNFLCPICGKEAWGKTKAKKFCSDFCAHRSRYKLKGRKRGKFVKCEYCGKYVWAYPRHLKVKAMRFCNKDHSILYQKKNAFRMECPICKKTFFIQPAQLKLRNRKTCSIECHSIWLGIEAKKNRIKNGFTKHQIDRCIRYSKEAEDWRKAIFERDKYTCRDCGKVGGHLEAHHLKPFAYFPELRFDSANGITLCRKCHDKTKIPFNKLRELYQITP